MTVTEHWLESRPRRARLRPVEYPESDGKPLGETTDHVEALFVTVPLLKRVLGERALVVSNLLTYYQEGDPAKRFAADVMVTIGIPTHSRRVYKIWEEGKVPDLLIEVTSRQTRKVDTVLQRALYQWLGVREYWMFDPLGEYLKPRLQGLRLVKGDWELIPMVHGAGQSKVLGLDLRAEGKMLRFGDSRTGEPIKTDAELAADAQRRAEDERRRAEVSAGRVAELEAEVRRLRAERGQ